MAKTSWWARLKKGRKFPVRVHNRCHICGRSRSFLKKFGLCRICFRQLAHQGLLPGVKKASW